MSSRIPSDPDDPTAPSSTVPITSTSASAPTSTSSRTGRVQPRRVDEKNDVDHEVDQDAEDDVAPPDTGRGSDPDVARSEDEADVVDNNDVDFGHPNWSAWCGRVSVACETSIEDAVALLQSNPALMNRLAANYKRRGRDGTVKYQHLLADLGLPFPSTRFEPLRAGLTSGSAYHMFLRQLTGLNGEQQQLSALAIMRLVHQGAVAEWQQSARYDVLPQKKSSQSRTSLSQPQEDTQSQASRSRVRVTTPRRSTRVAGSPSRPRRAVSNIVTAGPASPARRSLSKPSKPARSRDTSSDPGSSSTDSDDIAVSDSRSLSRRSRAGRDDGNHDMRKLQHAINTLTATLATRSVAPQPSISDRLRQQSGYDVMEDELMPSRPSRVTFAPARDDVSAATFRSMSQPVTSTTARTVPATDGVTEAMLGPVVYTRAGGNFKAWMEHAEFRQLRNKNEAQVWCEVLDGMLAEGISVHSRAFEAAARRLAAVFAADKYNNWDLARVISDGHAPGRRSLTS